ncbi:glycosyltransferase [Streptomyces sp. NPDC051896]|uniref:glycosyltransferase n=1 Tax=Streptomyces sp. NPDC051896 TaxID=3155416 RepID=UPI0034225425
MGMVVPTLGRRPDLLSECLGSLARQAADQEIVIVTTPDAVDRLARHGHPVIPQLGKGIAAAITTGWRHLGDRVDALGWLGDDDRLPDGSLPTALAHLAAHPHCSMVYGRSRYIDGDGKPLSELRPGSVAQWLLRLGHNLVTQPGCVYRRSAVEAIGGIDDSIPLAFDVDLHRRLIRHRPARYVPALLGDVRLHTESLTERHHEQSTSECEDCLVRHMPALLRRSRSLWAPGAHLAARATARFIGRCYR